MAAYAAVALCLAVAGVYGVMAYSVGRRTSEIGVRMALGAASSNILLLVMGQGLQLAAAGVAIGCALAWAVARVLRGMLFGVGSADPSVFSVVPVLLLATAAAACAVPALRAARVDPMRALRSD
jgi:putative ABC transport system permease protein